MDKNKTLELETRRNIYNHILRFPGIHFSDLCKKLNLKKNNVDYHLKILEKQGLIETSSDDGYLRYYPVKLEGRDAEKVANLFARSFPYETNKRVLSIFKYYIPGSKERKILNLIKRPVPQKIILFLYLGDESSLMEIARGLKKHWTTISFHLKKLVKSDVVERVSNGKEVRYQIKDPEYVLRLAFMYTPWRAYVNGGGELEYEVEYSRIDKVINSVYEIFPHPYHV
jgi:predicted transcriptional regulator